MYDRAPSCRLARNHTAVDHGPSAPLLPFRQSRQNVTPPAGRAAAFDLRRERERWQLLTASPLPGWLMPRDDVTLVEGVRRAIGDVRGSGRKRSHHHLGIALTTRWRDTA